MSTRNLLITLAIIVLSCHNNGDAQPAPTTEIHLNLSSAVSDTALSGRVYVMFDRNIYAKPVRAEMPDESSCECHTGGC